MPLTFAKIGETRSIKKILGNTQIKKHLQDLGFVVGEQVRIISDLGGNLIVSVKDVRIALSKELAQKLLI